MKIRDAEIVKPCPEQVEMYLQSWDALENYHLKNSFK